MSGFKSYCLHHASVTQWPEWETLNLLGEGSTPSRRTNSAAGLTASPLGLRTECKRKSNQVDRRNLSRSTAGDRWGRTPARRPSGCSAVWQRAWFGSRRSEVQIFLARPFQDGETASRLAVNQHFEVRILVLERWRLHGRLFTRTTTDRLWSGVRRVGFGWFTWSDEAVTAAPCAFGNGVTGNTTVSDAVIGGSKPPSRATWM